MEGREIKSSLSSKTEPLHDLSTTMQQHQSSEIMALKKAFADVILNTVKESATRVMASEQRALIFQQELVSSKKEALHVLTRLKQMMDAKTAEAENASLKQQRKIVELEAQLNEAEDIVTDLREELKHVYLMLEKRRNNQVQPLNGQNVKQGATFQKSAKPETLLCSPRRELECVTNYDVVNKSLTMNVLDDKCCNSKQQTEQLHISILDDSGGHESEFASIIMRSKEPELHRNGFTQRIHALEGNLLDEKLLMQDVQNQQYSKLRKWKIKEHVKCCHRIPKWKISSCYKSRFLPSCKIHLNDHCKSSKDVCSLPSIKLSTISKWKRRRRHSHLGMRSFAFRSCKPFFFLKQWSHVCENGKCSEDESGIKMKSLPPLTDAEPVNGTTGITKSVQALNKFELVKAVEKDDGPINLEESAALNLAGPISDMNVEAFDVPSTKSDLKDAKSFEENYRSFRQVSDSRHLKYTFQRKRKKLGNIDQNIDSVKSAVKKKVKEKPNGSIKHQNLT